MANPKSLIFQLHKHWDVIESLVRASRERPAFDEETVLRLIAKEGANKRASSSRLTQSLHF